MMTGASTAAAASMIASPCSILLMLNAGTPYPYSAAWSSNCLSVIRAIDASFRVWCPKDCHAREIASLEPFQECAASRRDMTEAVSHIRGCERRYSVAATGYGQKFSRLCQSSGGSGECECSASERFDLESSDRAVPEKRF